MADDEPRPQTLQERIAALNMGHVGRAPVTAQPAKRPPPPRPPVQRVNSANIPTAGSQNGSDVGNEPNGGRTVLPPPEGIIRTGQRTNTNGNSNGTAVPPEAPPRYTPRLPPRTNTGGDSASKPNVPPRPPPRNDAASKPAPPTLPARRPSELSRRDSQESTISTLSTISNSSRRFSGDSGRVKAPAYDPSTLPPLPPKRTQEDKDKDNARLSAIARQKSSSSLTGRARGMLGQSAPAPSLPRRPTNQEPVPASRRTLPPPDIPSLPPRRDTQSISPATSEQPPLPARPHGLPTPNTTPPPIPSATRPDLSKLMATKPKPSAAISPTADASSCLLCRDFSAVDAHAAKFPRQSVPSLDWLATQLTSPFPSATDQARAIFTWLHHNVEYDVEAFFNNRVQPSTPASTLSTGLAVCEGYAGLFATLATKAGLEAIVVGGHGKGYGYAARAAGSAIPPADPTGHAWNAVRIDGGEWKLLDPCWGAGHVQGKGQPYVRHFTPAQFTMSNASFGRSHFPANSAQMFLPGGRTVTWAEYICGDVPGGGAKVQTYGDVPAKEGFDEFSFEPRQLHLSPAALGPTVRFAFHRVCPHWDPLRHGPGAPYAYIMALRVPEGGKADEFVPFQDNGYHWWVDIDANKLGRRGDKAFVYACTTVGGQDAHGIPWSQENMYKGMAWSVVASWEIT